MDLGRFRFNRVYKKGFEALDGETGDVVFVRRVVRSSLRQEAQGAEEAHLTHAEASRGATVLRALPEHENVISYITSGEVDPDFYWVVDFFDYSLSDLIYGGAPEVNVPIIRFVMRALLQGVEHLHTHGVIHRNLKPANVLINRVTNDVKIGGFERARRTTVLPVPRPVRRSDRSYRSSKMYMAPEMLRGSTFYGPGADIWACGCIFAEMLFGHAIFCGDNMRENQLFVISRVLAYLEEESTISFGRLPAYDQPAYHPPYGDTLPPEVLSLLLRMLSFDPANRSSAQECLDDPYFLPQ